MSSPISPLGPVPIAPPTIDLPGESRPSGGFQQTLQNAIQNVEKLRQTADHSTQALLAGEGGELHQVILATQRAELTFELFLQMRNKVMQAYQEIMRMQM